MSNITECEGYIRLKELVTKDQHKSPGFHDYEGKLKWVTDRAENYAEKTGLAAEDILNTWEKNRNYWYMNYYQDANQPLLQGDKIRVFETEYDLRDSVNKDGFRCPACNGISKDPYECNSGQEISKGKICDWKVYGLFSDLGKGVYIFVKEKMYGQTIFMPIAWESEDAKT
jgi:hypothetical protein